MKTSTATPKTVAAAVKKQSSTAAMVATQVKSATVKTSMVEALRRAVL